MAGRNPYKLTNFVVIGLLAGFTIYYVANKDALTTKEQNEREGRMLEAFRADELNAIQIEREGVSFRIFRESGADAGAEAGGWKIEQGGQVDAADAFTIQRAKTGLDYASAERTIKPEEVNRAQFGLDKPRLKLAFTMGKLRTTVQVGGPAPRPEGSVYVDVDGKVKVVKKSAFDQIDVPPEAFRSRTLVPYFTADLRSMRFEHEGSDYTLERLVGQTWKLASGELAGTRADRLIADRMFTAFADLKADQFLPAEEAKKAQEGAPAVQVTMVPSDKAKPEGKFKVGGACPGHPDQVVAVQIAPKPLSACSGKGNLEALRRTADQLVDTRVLSLRDDEIEEVIVQQGDKKLEIARKGGGWRQRSPVEADVALDQVKAFVKALATTRSGSVSQKPPDGGFEASGRVAVRGPRENEDARPPEVVEVGKPAKDGSVVVRRQQDGAYLRLERDQARPFLPRTTALRSTQLISQSVDKVRKIAVSQGGELLQHLERRPDGTWTLVSPKGYPIDIGVAADLTENLMHLSAEQWVADQDDGSFGLGKPRLTVDVETSEGDAGATSYRLRLGEVGPAGVYGKLEGTEGVFVLNRSIEQTLTSLAVDLAVFMVNLEEVEQLTFRRPEGTLTLAAKGGQLQPPASNPDMPPSRLEGIKGALIDLRAQSVVHLGAARKEEGFDKPSLEITVQRRPGQGDRSKPVKITIGASDVLRNASIFYARHDGVDATYAIPAARVRALLALL